VAYAPTIVKQKVLLRIQSTQCACFDSKCTKIVWWLRFTGETHSMPQTPGWIYGAAFKQEGKRKVTNSNSNLDFYSVSTVVSDMLK